MNVSKTPSLRRLLWLSPLVVGVLILLIFSNKSGDVESVPTPASPASAPQKVDRLEEVQAEVRYADQISALEYRFKAPPGRVIEYGFDIRHNVTLNFPKNPMDPSQGDVEPQHMNLRFKGTLVSAAYASDTPDRLLLGYEVKDIDAEMGQEMTQELKKQLSDALKHEVLAYVSPRGRFEALYFPAEMPSQIRNLAREIILRAQIILPESPVNEWDALEEDVTGLFEAKYTGRTGELDGKTILEVSRRIDSYVAINSLGSGISKDIPTEPSGSTTAIVMLGDGWLRDLNSSEELKAGGGSFLARIEKKTEAGLFFRKIWQDSEREKLTPKEMIRRLSGLERASPIGLENQEEVAKNNRMDRLKSRIAGRSFQEVLKVLLDLFHSGQLTSLEEMKLRGDLAAIFELDPASVTDVLSMMNAGEIPVDVIRILSTAFGQAGTPSAQSALVELVTNEQMDPKVRISSLLAMATPQNPTEEAQKALQKLVDPQDPRGLGINTLLILGAMAGNLNRQGAEGSEDTVNFLLEQEEAFRNAGKTDAFLSALGNARDDRSFETVSRYLKDPSSTIRSSAVNALANLDHEAVAGKLMEAVNDQDKRVQVRAIRGLQKKRYTERTGVVVGGRLALSPSAHVRKTALRYFEAHLENHPEVLTYIQVLSIDDPNEDVRKLAKQLVDKSVSRR